MRFKLGDEELRPLAGLTLLAFAIAVLGLLGGLVGCNPGGKSGGEKFLADVSSFNNAVRWDRREEALARMTPAMRTAYLDRQEEIEDDVRVDDWELYRADVHKDVGTVRVRFWWHREREAVVQKTYVDQRWKKIGGRWLIVRARTRTGEPLPNFEKPTLVADDSR